MSYYLRYVVWLLAVIGLVIILIILILPSSNGSSKKLISGQTFVNYYSTNATATMLEDSPQGADSTHDSVRIVVSNKSVVYEQLLGYNYKVVKTQTFENNEAAYNVFLRSLYHAGFVKGSTDASATNPYGLCPLGDTYTFNFTNGSKTLEHFWATTCGNKTYGGNASLTVQLFQNQVPNYGGLVEGLNF